MKILGIASIIDVLIVTYGFLSCFVKLAIIRRLNYIFIPGHRGFQMLFTITPLLCFGEIICLSVAGGFTGYDNLHATALISMTSLILHSIFLAWNSSVYAISLSNLYLPAAWLLWSTACSLGLAFALSNQHGLIL